MADPVVVFTTDLDWASEADVDETLTLFASVSVPVTPFITHHSARIVEAFGAAPHRVGLHPNFQIQSTHGANETEVLDAVQALWPEARGFRSHGYIDSSSLMIKARERGLRWDSNLCLYMQQGLEPLDHFSGLVRFPCWWEDDVHLGKGYPPTIEAIADDLLAPGLKVLNFHPVHVALNTPSLDHYAVPRAVTAGAHSGEGIQSLLRDLLAFVREKGLRTVYLDDLFEEHDRPGISRDRRDRPYRSGSAKRDARVADT